MRSTFSGKLYTQWHTPETQRFAEKTGLNAIEGSPARGLGRDRLHHGENSGYQAINMAYLLGATRIILLGYNMSKPGGKSHFFGDHPKGLHNGNYENYIRNFDRLAEDLAREGVEVINCTPGSRLTQFRAAELREALNE